jgi:hypothetical protein
LTTAGWAPVGVGDPEEEAVADLKEHLADEAPGRCYGCQRRSLRADFEGRKAYCDGGLDPVKLARNPMIPSARRRRTAFGVGSTRNVGNSIARGARPPLDARAVNLRAALGANEQPFIFYR